MNNFNILLALENKVLDTRNNCEFSWISIDDSIMSMQILGTSECKKPLYFFFLSWTCFSYCLDARYQFV